MAYRARFGGYLGIARLRIKIRPCVYDTRPGRAHREGFSTSLGALMPYLENKTQLCQVMRRASLREVRLRLDFGGTALVAHS
jgi:hypothetical protein